MIFIIPVQAVPLLDDPWRLIPTGRVFLSGCRRLRPMNLGSGNSQILQSVPFSRVCGADMAEARQLQGGWMPDTVDITCCVEGHSNGQSLGVWERVRGMLEDPLCQLWPRLKPEIEASGRDFSWLIVLFATTEYCIGSEWLATPNPFRVIIYIYRKTLVYGWWYKSCIAHNKKKP